MKQAQLSNAAETSRITALTVISIATVLLAMFTFIACYIDFGNIRHEIGQLYDDEQPQSIRRKSFERIRSAEKERTSLVEEDSQSQESTRAVKVTDLAADVTNITKMAAAPPRLDTQAKQARIIEAPAIHETLEGIADKDLRSEGSPVGSPRRLKYPPHVAPIIEESQTEVSTTMHTPGLSNKSVYQEGSATSKARAPNLTAKGTFPTDQSVATTAKPESSALREDLVDSSYAAEHSATKTTVVTKAESVKIASSKGATTDKQVSGSTAASPSQPSNKPEPPTPYKRM
ncbi:hypothetical protein KIN20_001109 [Parelaphostrongylus tenuis]|uniref:Uncharacterized protein n=1 Tax=Parelaphostrongylus tenuis TaxID=148309 RepID=A0AAD5QEA3_PARTN|nr:hypothetical protein KIN20_001109 [Parelaphostrongylus tenuis]